MFNKINIELTNRCQKHCHICGRREREKNYPKLYNKDININLLIMIQAGLSYGCLIQFHMNGEPLLYPELKKALQIFYTTSNHIRCFDTNGILLVEKAKEIINNCEIVTVSIIENDPIWLDQLKTLREFLKIKGKKNPRVILRYVGKIEGHRHEEYRKLKLEICYRQLHSPKGSFNYKKECIKPEYMVCDEMLNHPAIDVNGNLSCCVRFDPEGYGIIGNIKDKSIKDLWISNKRREWVEGHVNGNRKVNKLCAKCTYWGIPRG